MPKKVGEPATSDPFTIVKCSDTWWPSTRQPQVSFAEGVPKIEKKYFCGFRSSGVGAGRPSVRGGAAAR